MNPVDAPTGRAWSANGSSAKMQLDSPVGTGVTSKKGRNRFLIPETSSRNLNALRFLGSGFLLLALFGANAGFSLCVFYS
jgi:hypothetical protein